MPPEDDKAPTYLIVILVIVVFVTFVLVGFYLYTARSTTLKPPAFSTTTAHEVLATNPPQSTDTYTGYIQELSNKTKTIDGVTYTHLIGLLDKNDESIDVWLTDDEYNALTAYDSRGGNKVVISLDDVKGGSLVRATRTTTLSQNPPNTTVIIEIID